MAQGEPLSKSKASKYLEEVLDKRYKEKGISKNDFNEFVKSVKERHNKKAKESKSKSKYIYNVGEDINYVAWDLMDKADRKITREQIIKNGIKTASGLISLFRKTYKGHTPYFYATLNEEEKKVFWNLEAEDQAKERLSAFDVDFENQKENQFNNFRSSMQLYGVKGYEIGIYQIRVYGVQDKNLDKFDKLYLELEAYFVMLNRFHRRRYFKEELEALTTEYKTIKNHLKKALDLIMGTEQSFIQKKSYGYKSSKSASFKGSAIRELLISTKTMDRLIEVNEKEMTFSSTRKPSDRTDLQYFYYLCWEMYKLIDDSVFKKGRYSNDKLFAEFCVGIQAPYIKANSIETTYRHLRDEKSNYKNLKFLNLRAIDTAEKFHKLFNKVFEI